ncbi:cysteine methyltransferase [Taibaiella sp. KBW10]|uniref:methylated-DNA--[protein]-cysteine S-methyltransferase n=1 Tax=Taibaiella sp. KBW10 TaxID=2153357 RepID=UPI000F5B6C73|nr:methylated-DNA--[protein]-cysteine S-methyltransferase [Taibaiella sp. KBW10]RQO29653.1 cysteine methyltransferase [Taibaiella sp. KBW10]
MENEMGSSMFYKEMDTPVGRLKLIASNLGLVAVLWEGETFSRIKLETPPQAANDHPILLAAEQQLAEYFAQKRKVFDLPLAITGTEFQKKVWALLATIPYGKTKTYGALAQLMGDSKTVRAVGGALNKNPVSIIIPCHRVIGAAGQLVGFAGGLYHKSYLLDIENPKIQYSLW